MDTQVQHVLLIRHGQTDANAAGVVQGHLPTPLNEIGRLQAELLAARLAGYEPKVTRLVSSPLVRAIQTAEPVGRALGLEVVVDEAWTERNFGSAQGKPADLNRIMTHGQPSLVVPEDAEPKESFDARVREALEGLPGEGVTAVMSHGGVIGSVMRQILAGVIEVTNPPGERVPVPNCSILHLSRAGRGAWRIECLHDVRHLGGLRTTLDAG
jgi:broad specificity phosphatase PhoE